MELASRRLIREVKALRNSCGWELILGTYHLTQNTIIKHPGLEEYGLGLLLFSKKLNCFAWALMEPWGRGKKGQLPEWGLSQKLEDYLNCMFSLEIWGNSCPGWAQTPAEFHRHDLKQLLSPRQPKNGKAHGRGLSVSFFWMTVIYKKDWKNKHVRGGAKRQNWFWEPVCISWQTFGNPIALSRLKSLN